MKTKFAPSRRLLAIVALLSALFTLTPWGVQFDNAIYDSISTVASGHPRDDRVVVVGIDEPSFQQLGLQWPWPREIHGQLIEQLANQGAKAIAFDLLFPEKSNDSSDQFFAEAIAKTKDKTKVVIGTDFKIIDHPQYRIKTPIEPIGNLLDAGAATGHVSIGIDGDGFVRRLEPVLEGSIGLSLTPLQTVDADIGTNLPTEFLINYAGGTQAITQASYYQALDAENSLPKDFFKDKIVFVGVRSLTAALPDRQSTDHYPTPLTRWRAGYTSGVMIHAFAAASILENSWITQFSRITTTLLGLLAGFIYIYFGISNKPALNAAAAVVAISCIMTLIFYLLRAQNLYIPALNSFFTILAVAVFSPYYNYLVEKKQRQSIKKAFSSYVNSDIVKQIEKDPEALKLGGKQIDGTVLFMDIAGFSGLSETESPEAMISFINDFLSAMIEIGMRNGGTVERFLGDAIMLIWGAPTAEPDHANLACQTALEMTAKIDSIADVSEQRYGFRVSARIGINSGSMTAGNIGGAERFCYTVLGDSVNLAARFEAANKNYGSRIIIGSDTRNMIDQCFHTRLIDITKVKGRTREEELFELSGLNNELSDEQIEASELFTNALRALQKGDKESALKHLDQASALFALSGSDHLRNKLA